MLVGMDASFRWIRIVLFGSQIQIDCVCCTPGCCSTHVRLDVRRVVVVVVGDDC